jgi:hypothetical protein
MARQLSRMQRLESRLNRIVRRYPTIRQGDVVIARWRAWQARQRNRGV